MAGAHTHNPELEGPLPAGFSPEGREGKVRNIYTGIQYGEGESTTIDKICLIASDRVSAFDQVSPTPIPGKGIILNDIARQELEAADYAGIQTWFTEVPPENPRAAIGVYTEVLPVEMIFRNYLTGSMWREYRDTGDFTGRGLPAGMQEWHHFEPALFTPSTKGETDVNFKPEDVTQFTGLGKTVLNVMEEIGRTLFELGTDRAQERGLVLVDTKYEMGVDRNHNILVIDEVHTPDSSRFVLIDEFNAALREGRSPQSLSKEFLRQILLERAGGDVQKAKELMALPLEQDIVDEVLARYQQLHSQFTM